ncbi:UDP-galactose transporter, putative [Plasmodium malariae]|uniref:UDP-galactose transporter, putative n=1 Tax=Plasmodium malariae TaxID=5858 RepID=A0A1D3PBI5_PLAMA|nr:UDP-galactose transporter, putative [Plasmodium malariae]SCN12654.1 UDP-galactose transporter, putative [Plasmodium malariae]
MVKIKKSSMLFWKKDINKELRLYNFLNGLFCVSGIYFFFVIFGYYQEKLPNLGKEKEKFYYNIFLIYVLCLSNSICSLFAIFIKSKLNNENFIPYLKNKVDMYFIKQIMLISITYSIAMIATNYSLSHVNFPTQVLVKSGKMIPIVVGGYLFFGKKYPYYDYISVFLITSSLVVFNLLRTRTPKEVNQTTFGLLLLSISLLCDGLTGPRQDKLLSKYNVDSVNLMFFVNIFAFIFNLIASLIIEGSKPYNFINKYTDSYYYILAFSISGSLGQFFVFYSLKVYGSLYTSLFTTLRKALSTVVSVYLFGHVLKPLQWGCISVIFSTLIIQNYLKQQAKRVHAKSK